MARNRQQSALSNATIASVTVVYLSNKKFVCSNSATVSELGLDQHLDGNTSSRASLRQKIKSGHAELL